MPGDRCTTLRFEVALLAIVGPDEPEAEAVVMLDERRVCQSREDGSEGRQRLPWRIGVMVGDSGWPAFCRAPDMRI